MAANRVNDLLVVIARALRATSARIVTVDEAKALEAEARARNTGIVTAQVGDARRLVVELPVPPHDLAALKRRLEVLIETFADLLPRAARRLESAQGAAPKNLHEELVALARRAGAADAVVIDAHSPVVWGSATDLEIATASDLPPHAVLHAVALDDAQAALQGLASARGVKVDPGAMGVVPRAICARHRVLPIALSYDKLVLAMADPPTGDAIRDVVLATGLQVEPVLAGDSMAAFFDVLDESREGLSYDEELAAIPPDLRAAREEMAERAKLTFVQGLRARRVIATLRTLPELETLPRGGHLRRMESEGDLHYLARSFAGIYVLCLIFEGPFEELLAKRAVSHSIGAIERLVAALPPLDPSPKAGAVALRRPRRRR